MDVCLDVLVDVCVVVCGCVCGYVCVWMDVLRACRKSVFPIITKLPGAFLQASKKTLSSAFPRPVLVLVTIGEEPELVRVPRSLCLAGLLWIERLQDAAPAARCEVHLRGRWSSFPFLLAPSPGAGPELLLVTWGPPLACVCAFRKFAPEKVLERGFLPASDTSACVHLYCLLPEGNC